MQEEALIGGGRISGLFREMTEPLHSLVDFWWISGGEETLNKRGSNKRTDRKLLNNPLCG